MPNTASAKKRLRQNETARIRNRAQRSDLRTSVRRVNEAIDAYATARSDGGDADAALATVNEAYVTVQKKAGPCRGIEPDSPKQSSAYKITTAGSHQKS